MKILITTADVDDVTAQVHADLIASNAHFESRQLDQQLTIFDQIAWPDIDIGTDPFWTFVVLADNERANMSVWARTSNAISDSKRGQVEHLLLAADKLTDAGHFAWVDRENRIQYSVNPVRLDDLDDGLKGVFAGVDDLLGKVTPFLRQVMNVDQR